MKVLISEACDGFTITLKSTQNQVRSYWFSQEDDKTQLVEVFNKLGFESEYEEDY